MGKQYFLNKNYGYWIIGLKITVKKKITSFIKNFVALYSHFLITSMLFVHIGIYI